MAAETLSHERNNFDAIRLVMALLVVWSHAFALHLGSEQAEWVSVLLHARYNAGNLGVMAFFVISGFLITQSWERSPSLRSYFEKRVRRIYPAYLVATCVCAFVVAPLFGGTSPRWVPTIALNLLLRNEIPDAFPGNPLPNAVNGSLWSIPLEFRCYIGVALVAGLLLKHPKLLMVLCALLLMFFKIGPLDQPPDSIVSTILGWPFLWVKVAPSFLLGMILYIYRDQLPRSGPLLFGLVVAAVAACWANPFLADLMVAPVLAYAVFIAAFSDGLKVHGAARYGDFSYGTYLYAFPIQQILQATTRLTFPEFIAVSMILSLLAGVLSWYLVERRFLRQRATRMQLGPQTSPFACGTELLAIEPRS